MRALLDQLRLSRALRTCIADDRMTGKAVAYLSALSRLRDLADAGVVADVDAVAPAAA